RYITAQSAPAKTRAAATLAANTLRQNLQAHFYRAALPLSVIVTNPRLAHILLHEGTATAAEAMKKIVLSAVCVEKWQEAKAKNDFSIVAPHLQNLVDVVRAVAERKAKAAGLASPYEAVIDSQTPGLRLAHLDS